jgi:hypothetical protein
MDVALHHITEGIIDQPVSLDEVLVLKGGRNNVHNEMAATAAGARMSGMFGAFISNFQ